MFIEKANSTSSTILTELSGAPIGFRELAKPQRLMVDVYYGGDLIGTYPAIVTASKIRFIDSKLFLKKIPDLVSSKKIATQLDQFNSSNSELICQEYHASKKCGVLYPKIAGVIYNPERFKGDIYINYHFFKEKKINDLSVIPNSSVGSSYINLMDFIFSGDNHQAPPLAPTLVLRKNQGQYNINSQQVLSYGNNRFNAEISYASQLHNNSTLQINEMNFQREQGHYTYAAGALNTLGSQFFPNVTLLGGSFSTTLKTLLEEDEVHDSHLVIFMNSPSQVSVFKDNRIIYSGFLQSGYQKIPTNAFPSGAYQLIVKTVDAQGNTNTRTLYYVKDEALPPARFPQYSISAGRLMETQAFFTNNQVALTNLSALKIHYARRFGAQWGAGFDVIASSDSRLFFAIEPILVLGNWHLTAGALVSNKMQYGYSGGIGYFYKKWAFNNQYLHISHVNKAEQFQPITQLPLAIKAAAIEIEQEQEQSNRLLAFPQTQFNNSLSYQFNATNSLEYLSSFNKNYNLPSTYSYGLAYRHSLQHLGFRQADLVLSVSRSQHDETIALSVALNFDKPNMHTNLQLGYQRQYKLRSIPLTNLSQTGLTTTGKVDWLRYDGAQHGYTLSVHGNNTPDNMNFGGEYNYHNTQSHGIAYINRNTAINYQNQRYSDLQYGGEFHSQLDVTGKQSTLSAGEASFDKAGVIVEVDTSAKQQDKFLLQRENHPGVPINSNKQYFIHLPPYHTYHLQIVNDSYRPYIIKPSEQVVTLYPGNIQFIRWQAHREQIFVGRLLNKKNRALKNVTIKRGRQFASETDNLGYFQIDSNSMTKLSVKTGTGICYLSLPDFYSKTQAFVFLGDVKCV